MTYVGSSDQTEINLSPKMIKSGFVKMMLIAFGVPLSNLLYIMCTTVGLWVFLTAFSSAIVSSTSYSNSQHFIIILFLGQ